ncbi:CAP domain-containing protein [Streptomyces sp. NPDC021098]|uniref:CAP domain-containing protein n=1 Tax=unclassified Streptomyces TaxID=2593676 RepID=UPI00379EDE40
MSKHRTTKTHHRKIAVAAVAVAAVGVPSVAMACLNGPDDKSNAAHGVETSASAKQEHGQGREQSQSRHEKKGHHRDADEPATTKRAEATKRASRSASATPRTRTTSTPATTLSDTAPAAAKSKAPATTAPATKAAAAPSSAASSAEAQVVELVNDERAKVGCSPVKVNAKLTEAAEAHSEDMAEHSNMSHTGSDGSSPGDRITRAGYSWSTYGENVAYGYGSAKSVMEGWMNSSGHKANILNCDFKEIGVGLSGADNYWTQDFGTAR